MAYSRCSVAVALWAVVCASAFGAIACSTPESLAGEGGSCFLATDCQPGLVCVPKSDGTRACSSNLSTIEHTPFAPGEAGASAEAGEAGASPDSAVAEGAAPADSAATDAGGPLDSAAPEAGAGDGAQPGSGADAPASQPGDASGAPDAGRADAAQADATAE
jgi:hypothetical protein